MKSGGNSFLFLRKLRMYRCKKKAAPVHECMYMQCIRRVYASYYTQLNIRSILLELVELFASFFRDCINLFYAPTASSYRIINNYYMKGTIFEKALIKGGAEGVKP